MKKTIAVTVALLGVALCFSTTPAAIADTFPPFPVSVEDPFSHDDPRIEQLNDAGEWVESDFLVCFDRPIRLIAPLTAEGDYTAFNYRLSVGHGIVPTSSSSAEFANASALRLRPGDSFQFWYLADAAKGAAVRLNSWSASSGFVPSFYVTAAC